MPGERAERAFLQRSPQSRAGVLVMEPTDFIDAGDDQVIIRMAVLDRSDRLAWTSSSRCTGSARCVARVVRIGEFDTRPRALEAVGRQE